MTYNVSMGTLNPTIPYHTVEATLFFRCEHFTDVTENVKIAFHSRMNERQFKKKHISVLSKTG